jgi:ABC-type multidrug transport system ATPase subunit
MIEIQGLTKSFGRERVLDTLALEARPGQVTLLVGANGSGKTTTLRVLAGLSTPDAGDVQIAGTSLAHSRMTALSRLSYLPQSPRFHARLTVGQILDFYARLRGLPAARAAEASSRWRLDALRAVPTARLSGGTRQRLALAVLMLPGAPVLALDEPGLSLDPDWRRFLHAELHEAASSGHTVLVATHLIGEWDGHADRCLVLERGRVGRELSPTRLRDAFPFAAARHASSVAV